MAESSSADGWIRQSGRDHDERRPIDGEGGAFGGSRQLRLNSIPEDFVMVAFQLSADMLGHARFCFSPLAEVASVLSLLDRSAHTGVHDRWLQQTRITLRSFDLDLLTALVPDSPWLPSFLYQPVGGPHPSLDDQLSLIEHDGIKPIAEDLALIWAGRRMPPVLADTLGAGEAGLREITGSLQLFWRRAVEPHWGAIQSILEDDVAHRVNSMITGGMYDLLEDIHPEAAIDGDLLRIHKPHHADQDIINGCRRLTLMPSVFSYPRLIIDHDASQHLVIVYGARGVGRIAEGLPRSDRGSQPPLDDHLAALLGGTRAGILTRLRVPMTTTQLASEMDQCASTISAHLSRLRDSGLLTTWRRGRRVYYQQTPLAQSLVCAGQRRTD